MTTRRLRRGLSVYPTMPPAELRRIVHRADAAGYDHVWFGDSQNIWREAYVSMAAAAVGTERVVFGTGVSNGVTRHRSVLASAWATLHEQTAGRVAAGFGVGDSALHTMGERPMRIVELESLIGDLRALWRGEAPPTSPTEYRLSYLDRSIDVPVFIAASGPRLLDIAGRLADGVILLVGTDPATVEAALDVVDRGARSVGRSITDLTVVLWAPVAIADDAEEARDRVRPHVARTVLRPVSVELSAAERAAVERIRAGYDYLDHMVPGSPHSRLVPAELVDRFAIAGTASECRRRLELLGGTKLDEVAMVPFAGPADPVELVDRFAAL